MRRFLTILLLLVAAFSTTALPRLAQPMEVEQQAPQESAQADQMTVELRHLGYAKEDDDEGEDDHVDDPMYYAKGKWHKSAKSSKSHKGKGKGGESAKGKGKGKGAESFKGKGKGKGKGAEVDDKVDDHEEEETDDKKVYYYKVKSAKSKSYKGKGKGDEVKGKGKGGDAKGKGKGKGAVEDDKVDDETDDEGKLLGIAVLVESGNARFGASCMIFSIK